MFDRYTKVVLTVIAVALSSIAAEGAITKAQAQTDACGDTVYNACYIQPAPLNPASHNVMPVYVVGGQLVP